MKLDVTLTLEGTNDEIAARLRVIADALQMTEKVSPERADRDRPVPSGNGTAAPPGAAAPAGDEPEQDKPKRDNSTYAPARLTKAMAAVLHAIHEAGGTNVHRTDILAKSDLEAYGLGRSLAALVRQDLIAPRFPGSDAWTLTDYGLAVARGEVQSLAH